MPLFTDLGNVTRDQPCPFQCRPLGIPGAWVLPAGTADPRAQKLVRLGAITTPSAALARATIRQPEPAAGAAVLAAAPVVAVAQSPITPTTAAAGRVHLICIDPMSPPPLRPASLPLDADKVQHPNSQR